MIDLTLLIGGLACLYFGSEWLLRGALSLSARFNLAPMAAGMVLLGLGTSAPELAVSLDAALAGRGDLAVGNIVGSNIVNFALVLGLAAAACRIPTMSASAARDMLGLGVLTALMLAFMHDQHLTRLEGGVLLVGVCTVLWSAVRRSHPSATGTAPASVTTANQAVGVEADAPVKDDAMRVQRQTGLLLAGIAVLIAGAEMTVYGAVGLARLFGIAETTIALTVTALGTGLPEIAATLAAMARRQSGLALGNVIGSNLVNIGLVLGISAMAAPLHAPGIGTGPLTTLAVLTALVLGIVALCRYLERWMGFALLSASGAYQATLFG